jgi:serine/threonine-protein kinase HipA
MAVTIAVYADWDGLAEPVRLGLLRVRRGAGREVFEFEFDARALTQRGVAGVQLDPRLGVFEGPQHPPKGRENFGIFGDASPDRWGRLLMRRRLEREQRAGSVAKTVRLLESDYLLGVHDAFRVGALRFRLDDSGPFLDDRHGAAAPPFVQLRELEAASLALERDTNNTATKADDWLRLLIAPGGSLGGARPKASVVDTSTTSALGSWCCTVWPAAAGCVCPRVWRGASLTNITRSSSSASTARRRAGASTSRRR